MATSSSNSEPRQTSFLKALRLVEPGSLVGPLGMVLILAMLIIPMPAIALSYLYTVAIVFAMMVMVAGLYISKAIEFSSFPTVLLVSTLLRLALNVATTRVILLHGNQGTDAAGRVIQSFGQFVVGGNFFIGIIVFAILVIINFVVVTKGATRIAEVSARFSLDAMPGKQMAIDADLNAGLIDRDTAKARREEVSLEADFFGAMDGAAKFVRGDAIAAILILGVNLLGGIVVGVIQHHMSFSQASHNYILLSIGDGLASQVPALTLSIAAGMVISRVSDGVDIGRQITSQVLTTPRVAGITAAILVTLGLIPGMPHLAFLSVGTLTAAGAYLQSRLSARKDEAQTGSAQGNDEAGDDVEDEDSRGLDWGDIDVVDPLGLEVGYRIIPWVENPSSKLSARTRNLRKQFAHEQGFLVPPLHIRDNPVLTPKGYSISVYGVEVGSGEVEPDMLLAVDGGATLGEIDHGIATREPAFGIPAYWIEHDSRDTAEAMGYTVVEPDAVIATHLQHVIQSRAPELLSIERTQSLLDHVATRHSALVDDLVPKVLPVTTVQAVLKNLLREQVPILDMVRILETLTAAAGQTQEPEALTAEVRETLGEMICYRLQPHGEIPVWVLDPNMERILTDAASGGESMGLDSEVMQRLLDDAEQARQHAESQGAAFIVLCAPHIRMLVAQLLLQGGQEHAHVVGQNEIPSHRRIRALGVLGEANESS